MAPSANALRAVVTDQLPEPLAIAVGLMEWTELVSVMVRLTVAPASDVPVTRTVPTLAGVTEEGGVTTGVAETVSFVFVVVTVLALRPSVGSIGGRGRRRIYRAGGAPPKVTARSTRSIFPAAHKVWAAHWNFSVENV